jgi:hypothetical protein
MRMRSIKMLSVIMEIELLKYIAIGMPLMFIATMVYIKLLLGIAKVTSGIPKFVLGMVVYLIFALALTMPLFYLISINQPAVQESTYSLIAVLVSYCLIVAPALYYLGKVKIKELQGAGYFLPRR